MIRRSTTTSLRHSTLMLLLLPLTCGVVLAQTPPAQPTRPSAPSTPGPLKLAPPPAQTPEQPKLQLNCMKPELKQIAYATKVSPGESLTVKGCGFGAAQGKVLLKGKFNQGFLKLDIVSWKDLEIEARVPAGVTGAPDHDAEIRLESATGLPNSEHKTIAFKAERETRLLTKKDFDFACQNSSYGYGQTNCGGMGESGVYGVCTSSICLGQKLWPSPDPNAFANLNNHPKFSLGVSLHNGWVVKSHDFESNSGADFFVPPIPVPDRPKLNGGSNGSANTTFVVNATNHAPTGWYWFKLKVLVEGPKGVPHDKAWSPG